TCLNQAPGRPAEPALELPGQPGVNQGLPGLEVLRLAASAHRSFGDHGHSIQVTVHASLLAPKALPSACQQPHSLRCTCVRSTKRIRGLSCFPGRKITMADG